MKLIRKGWLALLLLMFVSGGALAQAPDVPPGHWAYDAVRTLLERGYLDAEADGLFHGDNPVSRYALAGLIARLLEDIEAGRVQIGTAADVEMLRRLEGEFRAELVEWHAARQELEEAHARSTQRQIAVIDEQLNNILFALEAVDAELQAMEAAGVQRDQRLDGHDGELAALRDRFAQVQAQLQAAMDELYNSVVTVLGEHSEAVSLRLDQEAAETAAMFAALHARLDDEVLPALADVERRLSNQLAEQQAAAFLQMSQLDERHTRRMDELAAELASVRGMTAELGAALEDLGVVLSTEYRAELDQQAQGFSQAIEAVRGETERLDAVTQRLEQQVEELSSWIARVEEESTADLGNSVAELRAMISMLSGSLEEVQNNLRVVERHTAVLTDAVMDVMSETAALRSDVDALRPRGWTPSTGACGRTWTRWPRSCGSCRASSAPARIRSTPWPSGCGSSWSEQLALQLGAGAAAVAPAGGAAGRVQQLPGQDRRGAAERPQYGHHRHRRGDFGHRAGLRPLSGAASRSAERRVHGRGVPGTPLLIY